MQLSLIVRGQHPAGDDIGARHQDDLALVRRAEALGFDGLVKGSHYSAILCNRCSRSRFWRRSRRWRPGCG